MVKNPFWYFLIIVLALASLWFSIRALYLIYDYSTLQEKVSVKSIEWQVESLTDEKFVPKASYSYEVGGKIYQGSSLLGEKIYRNAYGVEEAIKALLGKEISIWYNPNNIQHSTIEKSFPVKESLYAFILVLILLYFIGLGIYVSRKKMGGHNG